VVEVVKETWWTFFVLFSKVMTSKTTSLSASEVVQAYPNNFALVQTIHAEDLSSSAMSLCISSKQKHLHYNSMFSDTTIFWFIMDFLALLHL